MALVTKSIKGTQDVLPAESFKIQSLESTARDTAAAFGFKEIRTPVFEHTELFARGVGSTTDVVQKEMYTFDDKGGRSITLRPEGTAGAVRAYLEHGLFNEPSPQKVYYLTSCYRYEKPQAGRLREFHQFGVECFSSASPLADAEIIALAKTYLDTVGAKGLKLELNSIGCPNCRAEYQKALKAYFENYRDRLCSTCQTRLDKNPMRILDCKSPQDAEIAACAPKIIDFLCDDCRTHFKQVQNLLSAMNIEFSVNPSIVRGLDYYTRTVFEFVSNEIGAQGTVCGGGRYDGLVEELGGPHTPALGFGLGLERLQLLLEAQNAEFPGNEAPELYIAPIGQEAQKEAFRLVNELRTVGIAAETDIMERSMKAQMKYADKIKARYTCCIGENEMQSGVVTLKNMQTGEKTEMEIDGFAESFRDLCLAELFGIGDDLFGELFDEEDE